MSLNNDKNNVHWLASLSLIGLVIVFFTNWPIYHYRFGGPETTWYYVIAWIMAAAFVFLKPKIVKLLLSEPMFYWFLVYALSGLLWVVFVDAGYFSAEDRSWRSRFLALLLFSACFVLTAGVDFRRLVAVWFGCALFAAVCFWIDYLVPFTFIPADQKGSNPGRAAGFFVNANIAGGLLVIMCIAIMPFIAMRWRIFLILVMGMGVFPTFSRSAMLLAILVSLVWILRGHFNKKTLLILLVVVPFVSIIGATLFSIGLSSTEINHDNVAGRLQFFETMGKESNDESAQERRYVAELAWQRFTENPLVGYGMRELDETFPAWGFPHPPHNMYLQLMFEQGIWGGILYATFMGIILFKGIRLYRRASSRQGSEFGVAFILIAVYFAFLGFFSNTLLSETVGIITLAALMAKERELISSDRRCA
ncbi:hypothetical protein W03_20280 [Nitrosomonas sp. PY1]|uniref:O-antigen ligase family protein n=1 Tax=Nitrosomonas sp. PY1 TaxID=1803906 RepID=UPI001FC8B69D|nr:O-antigen ligase family protein [Nitrosomonas sp. PY1]GKS70024.1 hypothetical protein W03_20280 [Nitrosomonas sp. PY1]